MDWVVWGAVARGGQLGVVDGERTIGVEKGLGVVAGGEAGLGGAGGDGIVVEDAGEGHAGQSRASEPRGMRGSHDSSGTGASNSATTNLVIRLALSLPRHTRLLRAQAVSGRGRHSSRANSLERLIFANFTFSRSFRPVMATSAIIHLLSFYASSGYNINSGRTFSSNSSGVRNPNPTVASFNVVPSLCAFFAHFATSAQIALSAPPCLHSRTTHCHNRGGCSESSQASMTRSATS